MIKSLDVARLVVLVLVTNLAGCEFIANTFIFRPDTQGVLSDGQLPDQVQELFIETTDRIKIHAYFIAHTSSEQILIYFHGNAGNICNRLPDLMTISRFGINVLGISYRGYGKSQGKPCELGLYLDGEAAFQFATGQLGFAAQNVILFGRSLGTVAAIHTAMNKEISGLILVTPLTSAKACARAYGFGPVAAIAGSAFNNIDKIERITCPLLVIHGTNDRVIPFAMGQAIYDKAAVEKRFVKIQGAGHNDLSNAYGELYWPPIRQFIRQHHVAAGQKDSGSDLKNDRQGEAGRVEAGSGSCCGHIDGKITS